MDTTKSTSQAITMKGDKAMVTMENNIPSPTITTITIETKRKVSSIAMDTTIVQLVITITTMISTVTIAMWTTMVVIHTPVTMDDNIFNLITMTIIIKKVTTTMKTTTVRHIVMESIAAQGAIAIATTRTLSTHQGHIDMVTTFITTIIITSVEKKELQTISITTVTTKAQTTNITMEKINTTMDTITV